jgi:PAS domain S-box-containing protein
MASNGDGAARRGRTLDFQFLVDSAPSLIHTGRPDGYLDFFNQPWLNYVGRPLDALQGWNWTAFIHPEDVEGILKEWRASLASGEPFLYEARVLRADGEYRWMLHHKVAILDGAGKIVKWHGSSIDIEDRKRAEERLQRSEFYLAEGQRLAHVGSWAFDPAGFSYWSTELFRIHGLDPAGKPPALQEYLNLLHPEDRDSMANLIAGLSSKPLSFDATKRIVRPGGEIRYIRCVGVPADENPQSYIGSAVDVTEHELATQELRRREAYLAEAQKLTCTGSFGWRPDSGEIVWSDETYRIFEYDRGEKPTLDMVFQRIHPHDRAVARRVLESISASTDFEHQHRLVMPSGAVKHIHVRERALLDSSGKFEIAGAVTDITERKAAEDKIRRLVDAGILGIFIGNIQGEIVEPNEAFLNMLQFSRADLLSGRLRWPDLTPPEWRERDKLAMAEVLANGVIQPYEKEFLRKDGSRVPVLIGSAMFQDKAEGVVFVLDLSELKGAEKKIRGQEIELRQILDLTPQHVAVISSWQERIFASRALLHYFGLSLEDWRLRGTQTRVHPDDLERLLWGPQGDPPEQYEARLRRYDGAYRWFLVRNNPLYDEQGKITRWYVAGTDIHDRKQAEEKLRQENVALREEIDKASMFEEIVGTSKPLRAVLSQIAKVAPTGSTVLINGETGTGKELIARALHKRSQRSAGPFVSVNCAALPPTLVSSELFGHEKGAFTGATERRLGRFEMADGGTIFLDEVGELLPDTQASLLRVLQEREIERVGGGQSIPVDVRVIAATNRDLNAAVVKGTFRQDLLYRLNVFPIEIPPLRERRDDILILVEYFVQRYANRAGRNIRSIDQKTLELLQSYDWPGNIRELQNIIERSIILSSAEVFSVDELWLSKRTFPRASRSEAEPRTEREIIEAALAETRGRVAGPSGAAAKLRIPPSTLETRIKVLKINKQQFKFR